MALVAHSSGTDGARRAGDHDHRVIGVISPNAHGYFFGTLLSGVLDVAAARDVGVVTVQANDAGIHTFSDEPFSVPLGWDHFDALVVTMDAVSGAYLRAFAESGRPVVTVYKAPEDFTCPTVVPDNEQGVRVAVDHLAGHGHTRIAFVGRDPANADDWSRYAAYREAVLAHGLAYTDPVLVPWDVNETYRGAGAVDQLRARGEMPSAVIACTDGTAIALIDALAEADLVVPDDIALIGFDDIPQAAGCRPPLSTVAQSFSLAGATACSLVCDALDGDPPAPGLHLTPTTLVVRQSCGCRDAVLGQTLAPGIDGVCARFVEDLEGALFANCEQTPARRQLLDLAGHRLVGLLTTVAGTPSADVSGIVASTTEVFERLAADSQTPLGALGAISELARQVASCLDPDDVAVAERLERQAFAVSTRLLRSHKCTSGGLSVFREDLAIQRRRNLISTNLVRRYHQDVRSLSWLEGTEARVGCLALWESGRDGPRDTVLRLISTYADGSTVRHHEERCEVTAFPPASFIELARANPGDVSLVLPVRFDGSDWGFLALSGALDIRGDEVTERFNHWVVLLTVALDQELAITSERAMRRIQVSEERHALAAEAANDGLWDWDLTEDAVYYSTRWKALLGYTEDEVGATPDEWLKRIHPDDRSAVDRALADHFAGRTATIELEHQLRCADGGYRWMLTQGRSVLDEAGQVRRVVGSMTDITVRKRLEERLRHDASYDVLTGLPNRAFFLERLGQAISRSRRYPGYTFAVVFLDLDSFKVVNDSLGHQIGDELLVQVAKRLTTEVRGSDTVCRFGGDEFIILFEDVRDPLELPGAVERLLSLVAVPLLLAGTVRSISSSAGIAIGTGNYRTAEDCVRDADTAMYRAKALGPGRVVVFDEAMHVSALARLQLESDLEKAIIDGQFELHYQPILRLEDRWLQGFEALIRWRHPERGLIAPGDFLPVAEITGQARQIGRWTIREACRQTRAWLDASPGRADFTVSINLSDCQFWDPELRPTLQGELAASGVSPSTLVIEVTEGVIVHNRDAAIDVMRRLREDGFALHLDDFGTGYSSLSTIQAFPVSALKIDRSFVGRMGADSRSRELVTLMIDIGSRLGLEVIAEGIETEAEAELLRELGCPLVQGFLFSRPVPAMDAAAFLPPTQPRDVSAERLRGHP
ncbi:MAG: EAL domain-containing protein [Actinomycetales bacterium]|nr:EAL domain-containing protein [Actinomycetales bacterium]